MILWYKNSFWASVLSIFGSLLVIVGIVALQEDVAPAIGCMIAGIALILCGRTVSQNKAFKKWWKQVTDANLEPVIAQDINTAIAIYNKNPQKRTLKKIAQLNPEAARRLAQK